MSDFKEIWETLSKVDVSDHIQSKNGLSFLSWAWAWGTLMKHYPQAEYYFREPKQFPDGSFEVECTLTIDEHKRHMWLPVMDYKNKAIPNPSARDISDAKMRCLVKVMAMFGLGHYIYAGEDLPEGDPYSEEQKARFDMYIANEDALRFYLFVKSLPESAYNALYNSFEKGKKTSMKKACNALEMDGSTEAQAIVEEVTQLLFDGDPAWQEELEGLQDDEKKVLASMFDTETINKMREWK